MKKQLIARLTLFATLLSVVLFSCKKDEEVALPIELKVMKESLEFKAEDAEQTVEITSNYGWEAKSNVDWCKVKVEKTGIVVTADAYSSTEVDRYATITVKSANGNDVKMATIDVTQTKLEPAALVLNPGNKAILECEGLVPTIVEIISTVGATTFSWEGGKPEWMNEPVLDGGKMTLTAQDNPTKEKRTAKLIITVGKKGNQASETLEIEQSPNAPYAKFLPSNEIVLDYEGKPVTVEVYWNTEYFDLSELVDGSWGYRMYQIEEVKETTTGLRAELLKTKKRTFKIWLDMNPKTEERFQSGAVYAKSDKGKPNEISVFARFKVIQQAAPVAAFNLSRQDILFPTKGGEETVKINPTVSAWDATCDASWVKLTKKGNDLVINTTANAESQDQKAVIHLSCGLGSNVAKETLNVTIAGVETKIALSTDLLVLDPEGKEKIVNVLTGDKDWFVEGTPDWLTVKEDRAKGTLSVKATKADAPREVTLNIVAVIGGGRTSVPLIVKQSKQYKIGEVYSINGKPVGIVYNVYNNGTNGYVFSFEDSKIHEQNLDPTKIPCWSIGMYAGNHEEAENLALKNMEPCCLDVNDGRNNLEAAKKRSEADLRGMTWQERYPALAWVDQFNQEHGNQGWYMPAKNELKTLVLYLNGIYEGSGIVLPENGATEDPDNAKKRTEAIQKINDIIREHKGDIFYRDTGIDGAYIPGASQILSSTEAGKNESGLGFVGIYLLKTIYPWWDQYQHASAVSEREISDVNIAIRSTIRPILRF